jgi:hypothetical protein
MCNIQSNPYFGITAGLSNHTHALRTAIDDSERGQRSGYAHRDMLVIYIYIRLRGTTSFLNLSQLYIYPYHRTCIVIFQRCLRFPTSTRLYTTPVVPRTAVYQELFYTIKPQTW